MTKVAERRQPRRTCIVCGSKRVKVELLRLALDEKNKVCLDYRQRRQGRGSYVCPRPECLTRVKLAYLEKAFRRTLPQGAWDPALTMAEALQRCSVQTQEQ
ncbi:MAG: YlxR family protein [Syntrophobacterales bacterium]